MMSVSDTLVLVWFLGIFLLGTIFFLHVFRLQFVWLWHWVSRPDTQPIKKYLRIGGVIATLSIVLAIGMMMFSNEGDGILDLLSILLLLLMILVIVIALGSYLILRLLRMDILLEQKPIEQTEITKPIRMQKTYLWIGMLVTASFVMIIFGMLLFSNETSTSGTFFIFLFFTLLSIALILAYFNIRITLEGDVFIYRNFRGKTQRISYDSIERYKITYQYIILYIGKKKYRFEREAMVGIEEFQKELETRLGEEKRV